MVASFKKSCNHVKVELAGNNINHAELSVDACGDDGFVTEITRETFEEVACHPFRDRLLKPVNQILENTRLRKNQIDEVVLVGGSTRIPWIQELVQNYFSES